MAIYLILGAPDLIKPGDGALDYVPAVLGVDDLMAFMGVNHKLSELDAGSDMVFSNTDTSNSIPHPS